MNLGFEVTRSNSLGQKIEAVEGNCSVRYARIGMTLQRIVSRFVPGCCELHSQKQAQLKVGAFVAAKASPKLAIAASAHYRHNSRARLRFSRRFINAVTRPAPVYAAAYAAPAARPFIRIVFRFWCAICLARHCAASYNATGPQWGLCYNRAHLLILASLTFTLPSAVSPPGSSIVRCIEREGKSIGRWCRRYFGIGRRDERRLHFSDLGQRPESPRVAHRHPVLRGPCPRSVSCTTME